MLAAFQAVGLGGLRRLDSAEILACTRIAKNMSAIGYTGAEIALLLRALYLSASRQDVREVWWLFDRRHVGQLPRHEVEDRLKEILGDEVAPLLHKELDKLTRDRHRGATSSDDGTIGMGTGMQRVGFAEFAKLLAALAHGRSSETIAEYLKRSVSEMLDATAEGVVHAVHEVELVDPAVSVHLSPAQLAGAGAVAERLIGAGFSKAEASTAVHALFVQRDQRTICRLWGLFDAERAGCLDAASFNHAMGLLTRNVGAQALDELRKQMGFVDPDSVTLREFEALLRLLVPVDGGAPDLRKLNSSVQLSDILGGDGNVQRLHSFQRQRVALLGLRMRNFGYSPAAVQLCCRALFLTKLHNRDLWRLWRLFSRQDTERPLAYSQVRHVLALLSEDQSADDLLDLTKRVDADGSGTIEFEEFAVLLRAIDPKRIHAKRVEEVTLESPPPLSTTYRHSHPAPPSTR